MKMEFTGEEEPSHWDRVFVENIKWFYFIMLQKNWRV
jgi:hypothetical protein